MMCGGGLYFVGLTASAFVESLEILYVTYGVIAGKVVITSAIIESEKCACDVVKNLYKLLSKFVTFLVQSHEEQRFHSL